jgi:hypothetical protein
MPFASVKTSSKRFGSVFSPVDWMDEADVERVLTELLSSHAARTGVKVD